MTTVSLQHPWQSGPTELIEYAITLLHQKTDFQHRLAFLLLDVGVETLFKTYLALPDEVSGTKLSYGKRKAAIEGSFHELVNTMVEAAKHKLDGYDLSHVEFYHGIRNRLYHHGNGITVTTAEAQAYAQIAVDLLKLLLDVDLTPLLNRPQELARQHAEQVARDTENERVLQEIIETIKSKRSKLVEVTTEALEHYCPQMVLPSFKRKLSSLEDEVQAQHVNQWDGVNIAWHADFNSRLADTLEGMLPAQSNFPNWVRSFRAAMTEYTVLYIELMAQLIGQSEVDSPDFNWTGIYAIAAVFPEPFDMPRRVYTMVDQNGNSRTVAEDYPKTEVLQRGQEIIGEVQVMINTVQSWQESFDHST